MLGVDRWGGDQARIAVHLERILSEAFAGGAYATSSVGIGLRCQGRLR